MLAAPMGDALELRRRLRIEDPDGPPRLRLAGFQPWNTLQGVKTTIERRANLLVGLAAGFDIDVQNAAGGAKLDAWIDFNGDGVWGASDEQIAAGRDAIAEANIEHKAALDAMTDHFSDAGVKVRYLHSDIDTVERVEIIRDLRAGVFDVLIGINLLREGLDLPEVALVGILDADKEGFLRGNTSLIQTIGRAARNAEGKAVMYADRITGSMQRAIGETDRRRQVQAEYNAEHDIVPRTIVKSVEQIRFTTSVADARVAESPGQGAATRGWIRPSLRTSHSIGSSMRAGCGKSIVNCVPRPTSLCTLMRPP